MLPCKIVRNVTYAFYTKLRLNVINRDLDIFNVLRVGVSSRNCKFVSLRTNLMVLDNPNCASVIGVPEMDGPYDTMKDRLTNDG